MGWVFVRMVDITKWLVSWIWSNQYQWKRLWKAVWPFNKTGLRKSFRDLSGHWDQLRSEARTRANSGTEWWIEMGDAGGIGKQTRKKLCQFYPTGSNHLFGTFCGKLVSLQWFRPSMMMLYSDVQLVLVSHKCARALLPLPTRLFRTIPLSVMYWVRLLYTLIDPYLLVLTHRRGYTCGWEHYRHCMGAMLSGDSETIRRLGVLDANIRSPRMQN